MTELISTKCFSGWISTLQRPVFAGLCAAVLAAGCSADVTRFGGSGFSLNGDSKASLLPSESLTGGGGAPLSQQSPDAGYGGSGSYGRTSYPIKTSALPERMGGNYSNNRVSRTQVAERSIEPTNSYSSNKLAKGEPITVSRGDTLYGLSRRHGVSVAELMSVNGLNDSMLRVGQRLYLPTRSSGGSRVRSASRAAPSAVVATADAPSTWNGSYQVRSGDSLYKIARQYGVRTSDLQRYNAITDPRRVMPGTVLRVPGGGRPDTYASTETTVSERPAQKTNGNRYAALTNGQTSDAMPVARGVRTVAISPTRMTKTVRRSSDDDAVARLRWPVRGKMIAGFGSRADGTHNDGVNFAVPTGTDVSAADEGVVAYAGSELRSYGNLILLRHDNGWVTAYAHNSRLMVSRGDKVQRGQVIAKSGDSGQVDQPQVHFELRQSSKKPVDPIPYLEKL